MGISQHTHGTDNARCLIALSLITGQIGRPGTGLHPLRGQNNVQGASDAGLIPMFFPDYKSVEDAEIRARYEDAWGTKLDPKKGLTVVEIMDAVHADEIKGMYIMGENPAMSDPDLNHAREALAHLEHLVVQDLFLTETAVLCRRGAAGLGLAGEGRHRHQHQPPGADGPPGAAAAGRGQARLVDHPGDRPPHRAATGTTSTPSEIYTEMASLMPSLDNISWERVERESAVTYPADAPDKPGRDVVFDKGFPRPGRLRQAGGGQAHAAGRDAGRGISVHPHHRPPARALAHRRHDAPRDRARCARARPRSLACRAAPSRGSASSRAT